MKFKWIHRGGDLLASMMVANAYAHTERTSNLMALKKFCAKNGLNYVIMQRIHRMRLYLAKLSKRMKLSSHSSNNTLSFSLLTGDVLRSISPPDNPCNHLLLQAINTGFLDNIARRATSDMLIHGTNVFPSRVAYFSCRSCINDPLFIHKESVLYSKDYHQLPEWICYSTIVRKLRANGTTISIMKNITPVNTSILGLIAESSRLIHFGRILDSPIPQYDYHHDAITCHVLTKFG